MTTLPVGAGAANVMVSPVSTLALAPLWSSSFIMIQPCPQSPAVVHWVPLALLQTVTRAPRLMAFERACAKVAMRSLVAARRLDDAIID